MSIDTIYLIINILVIPQLITMLIDLLFSHFAFKAADKQEYEKAIKLIKIDKTVLLICSPLMFLALRKKFRKANRTLSRVQPIE